MAVLMAVEPWLSACLHACMARVCDNSSTVLKSHGEHQVIIISRYTLMISSGTQHCSPNQPEHPRSTATGAAKA